MFVVLPINKSIREMTAQIKLNCKETFTIFAGLTLVTNLAFKIDPNHTDSAATPKYREK